MAICCEEVSILVPVTITHGPFIGDTADGQSTVPSGIMGPVTIAVYFYRVVGG